MKRVLAIGGSDSGAGAGIQADLKAVHSLGVHASTVITAVTAQSTVGVSLVHELPLEVVSAQLTAVLADIGADVVKTGMLASADLVALVARTIEGLPLVVDPVAVSTSGQSLLTGAGREALIELLLPLALVVTPNLDEVEVLTGVRITSASQLLDGARAVHALGPTWVLVTGGHLEGDALDLLYDGTTATELHGPRLATRNTHGTGCTLASALAAYLALGHAVPQAAELAKDFVSAAIRASYPLGSGAGPVRSGGP